MTALALDKQHVARQLANAGNQPQQLLEYVEALIGDGLRSNWQDDPAVLVKMSTFIRTLDYHGYRSISGWPDGDDHVTTLVDYLPMPAELTPALDKRFTYVQDYRPIRLPRDEVDVDQKANACWVVAQWSQTANVAEITCLAALLVNCLPIPVDQLLDTAALVAA